MVIAAFLHAVYQRWPMQKILVLTHVKELIEQNFDKLMRIWPTAPAGIYSAGLGRRDLKNNIIVAGIASLIRQVNKLGHVDLIIIDEAHLVSNHETTMYRKLIAALLQINPSLKVIGLTATPWRLGHGHLTQEGGVFTDVCIDMTTLEGFTWFLTEGYLLPPVPKKPSIELSVDGVHKQGGEFVQKELQRAVDKEEITRVAVEEAIESGASRNKWLVFCAGVEHCINAARILNEMGVEAAAVHSKMKPKERDAILAASRRGDIQAITNNNVLTTGYDDPEIDLEIILRPTASPVLWVQMLGRGTRPCYADGFDLTHTQGRLDAIQASQKQDCLVLDFAGNTRRLGPINDPVVPKQKGKKGGSAPIKLCDECGTWNHASVRHCATCGQEFVFETKLTVGASTQRLVKEAPVPQTEIFPVEYVTYHVHTKRVGNNPPSMKVTYYCGLRRFVDYVCIEHNNFAGRKARRWWRARTDAPMPATTAQGVEVAHILKEPTHIKVWINKTHPEIMAYCFDGSGQFKDAA